MSMLHAIRTSVEMIISGILKSNFSKTEKKSYQTTLYLYDLTLVVVIKYTKTTFLKKHLIVDFSHFYEKGFW